jgi:hypothetical protein
MQSDISMLWKFLYIIPVLPVYLIVYCNFYTVTAYYFMDGKEVTLTKLLLGVLFYTCTIGTIVCHTISMWKSPGYVDQSLNKEDIDTTAKSHLFCKKCEKPRPERAHHCRRCGKCVLKMDHHCPWIANCVGYYNQKAFYLFLFYATLGDIFGFICLLMKLIEPSFYEMIIHPKVRINFKAEYLIFEIIYALKDPLLMIIGTCTNFTIALAVGVLFGYQTYLIVNNITSIESNESDKPESSHLYCKDKLVIFKSVMGDYPFEWFLPVFRSNVYNAGYSYYVPGKLDTCDN